MGFGACIRDEFGLIVGAKTFWSQPLLDVKIGEAIGLKLAFERVREIGFIDVVFEMDSKSVVELQSLGLLILIVNKLSRPIVKTLMWNLSGVSIWLLIT